ncbi:hypothetical protein [Actinomadura rudentiformis]|uniref:hypothetical protein n=1 Tax=Actinomadura rudentiformis TaxID=359158 RepID=UPI00178C2160|nr:hypothetical protein [Actinomadura rudentiformis]
MIEARDTEAKAAKGGTSGRDFWPDDKPGSRGPKPKLLFGVVAALVAVVLAVVAAVVLTGGDDGGEKAAGTSNGPGVLPVAYTPQMADKAMVKLAKRTADPRPVTQDEVFPADAKAVKYRTYAFSLAASQVSDDCVGVTWGQRLRGDLAKYGCTQVARGSYVSQDKRHLGQIAVLNMVDENGAEQIVRDLDPATNAGFVLPLNATGQPAFGKGFSAAYSQVYGHYVIITWVQRAGGVQPASLNEMIDASLAIEKPADFVWGRLELVPTRRTQ